ncbi:hypothetical protein [Parasulfitobacter algicola]|uniref:Antifreeze glycopeptide polyprotein n=1 Tax=Parasulfitobacter algicola TaxID=2614809 RepID=A0ABX2IYM1_9RHOB|nr:hypothetical protein [Sulfitobacter algicola]NSX55358.1 hypothetical protein [Sulfitobacter algicola]
MLIRLTVFTALFGSTALAEAPLSAIDWLSDSLAISVEPPLGGAEPPVSAGAGIENVSVMPLDVQTPDAVGLLPTSVTGLPPELWGSSDGDTLSQLILLTPAPRLPALQDLMNMLLLAEVNPPMDADFEPKLLLARIDALLDVGAIDAAKALLERADTKQPDLFRRWFDLALLSGTEDAACEALRDKPGLTPSFSTRIFCLARNGDWSAAALTLETGVALGQIDQAEEDLMVRFLEHEETDHIIATPPPSRITPLEFRIREAIGEPLPTTRLPLAFVASDLRSNTGWKAQLEAAERLARVGAIPENQLLGIYSDRRPSASGGIWDRARAIQNLDKALTDRNAKAVQSTLSTAWAAMQQADLEVAFANLFTDQLMGLKVDKPTKSLVLRIALLSDSYEAAANQMEDNDAETRFLKALARGELQTATAHNTTAAAVKDAFTDNSLPEKFVPMLREKRIGEAILRAIALLDKGAGGDMAQVTQGLKVLRSVGLEDTARQAALQLLLLERG